jgi:hypothetical protein
MKYVLRQSNFAAIVAAFSALSYVASCASSPAMAAATVKPASQVSPLKGGLDKAPMFNSNCPEVVQSEGILLSTLSGRGKDIPENHLSYIFKDQEIAIFFHHLNKQPQSSERKILYLTLVAYNPDKVKVATLTLDKRASFLSQPDAPFVQRPTIERDDDNTLFAGPGDRVTGDYLHNVARLKQEHIVHIQPCEYRPIEFLPVPVKGLTSFSNGRSYLAWGKVKGKVQLALVATFATETLQSPDMERIKKMLVESYLAKPREYATKHPSNNRSKGPFIYGRVAGVSRGRMWSSKTKWSLLAGKPLAAAFPISSLKGGTFGTKQIQAAPLFRRYDDTAYSAHGNYCLCYTIDLQVRNDDSKERTVIFKLSTPLKSDKAEPIKYSENEENAALKTTSEPKSIPLSKPTSMPLSMPLSKPTFYRGSVRVSTGIDGLTNGDFWHLVMHKGEDPGPLGAYTIAPRETRFFQIELFYPPDATPPQVLSIDSPLSP